MTLMLELAPEMAEKLRNEAVAQGLSTSRYTLHVLEQHFTQMPPSPDAVNLLQQWLDEEDAGEQQSTGDFLVEALDADRLANRQLFPDNLEGITW